MKITRRELLTFAGGSLLGALFTPIPWKLLDDSSIWTQNWSLIPGLPRGPETFTATRCALCPAGCAVRARRIDGQPVTLAGIPTDPFKNGALCPMGIAGHHLAFHPLRLRQPFAFTGKGPDATLVPVGLDEIVSEVARTIQDLSAASMPGSIAILDQRPGRAVSGMYREFMGMCPQGTYIVPPGAEEPTLATLQRLCDFNEALPCFDLENTGVILSFGSDLLDGWSSPSHTAGLIRNRNQNGLNLIQAEGVKSRTAHQANTWLPVIPGTEAALALSIGHVIIRDGLHPREIEKGLSDFQTYKNLVAGFPPDATAAVTGIAAQAITTTAHAIASGPSVVIAGCNPAGGPFDHATETAIAGLNLLVGNVGRKGGITLRARTPSAEASTVPAVALANVPDHSIRLLFVDGAESGNIFPASLLRRKLTPDGGTVVLMSPYLSPRSAGADYLIPSPAAYESMEEISTRSGASRSSFALSLPLLSQPEGTVDPVAFLAKVAEQAGLPVPGLTSSEACLKQRAHDIWASKRGSLTAAADSAVTPVQGMSGEEDLWKGLSEGGCWIDGEEQRASTTRRSILGSITPGHFQPLTAPVKPAPGTLKLMAFGWRNATMTASVAPVLSKIFQESHLRSLGGKVHLNPSTIAAHALVDGARVSISTQSGTVTADVVADPAIIPGVIHAIVGPSPNNAAPTDQPEAEGLLGLCVVGADGTWRITEATIARA